MKKLYQTMIFSFFLVCLPLSVSAGAHEGMSESKMHGVVKTDGENITLTTTGGGFKLKSDNGNSFQLKGRIQYDYDSYNFDRTDFTNAIAPNARFQRIGAAGDSAGSGGELRRARITAKGTVAHDWAYELMINVDDDTREAFIPNGYLSYNGFKPFSITLGQFKEPFSMERLASSNATSAIERGLILDLIPEGNGQPGVVGLMFSGHHAQLAHFNWAWGIFADGNRDPDYDVDYAFTGRATVAPHMNEHTFFHLGAAYSHRENHGAGQHPDLSARYRISSRMGVNLYARADDPRIDTNADPEIPLGDRVRLTRPFVLGELSNPDSISQYGLEAAFVMGPFSLQAEYVDVEVEGGNPGGVRHSDLEGDGYYIQGAWTITGEQRSYKANGGYFGSIKPKGPLGALELVARYEELDVEHDGLVAMANDGVDSEAEKMLLGINWYPTNTVRFMLNYIDAEADRFLNGVNQDSLDGDAISFRAQYAF